MLCLRSRSREVVHLAIGIMLGVAGSAVFASTFYRDRSTGTEMKPLPADVASEAASSVSTLKALSPAGRSRWKTPAAGGAADWKRLVSEYRAAGGTSPEIHRLLYQLDAKGLRKLAVHVASWPPGGRTTRALREIYRRWAEVDPMAAFAQLRSLDADTQAMATFEATRGFVNTQPQQAAAYFAAPPPADAAVSLRNAGDRRLMLNLALAAWAEQDGQAAFGFLGQLPGDILFPGPAGSLGAELARQNPAAALSWALNLKEQNARSGALEGVIDGWVDTDPGAAANYVLNSSGDVNQSELIKVMVTRWASRDLAATARWVAGQSGPMQAKTAAVVANEWSSQDPAAAIAWASQLPEATRTEAYGAISEQWYDQDPAAAREWLSGLSAGDARDAAIGGFLDDYRNYDPPTEKIGWAERIGDAQKRDDALVKILNTWLGNAPQTARQWIGQANLPASVIGKLSGSKG